MGRVNNDGDHTTPETVPDNEQQRADNRRKMEDKRAEDAEKEKAEASLKVVIDTAALECTLCTNPKGIMVVNYNTPTIQEKKTATVKEKGPKSLVFTGNCLKSPNAALPCASVMKVGEWKKVGTYLSQEQLVLLQQSTIPCNYGQIDIKITDSGQIHQPDSIEAKGAPVPNPKDEGKCFCDREMTLDELKLVVKQLRASEKKKSTAIFSDENCPLPAADTTYERLLEELNTMFKTYHINTCIRKIHFFAQCYHETARLGTTLEYASGVGYDPGNHPESKQHGHTVAGDGPRYKGRGGMQLTWRDQQKEYLTYVISKKPQLVQGKKIEDLFDRKKQYQEKYIYTRDKLDDKGNPVLNKKKKKVKEKVVDLVDVDGAGLIANSLYFAIDSAGWFWDIYKTIEYGTKANKEKYKEILHKNLNEVSDYGDKYLSIISKFVNGGGNGMAERNVYYNELKTNVFKFNTKCINRDKIKK
ncbi:uncharacterized protein CHSO_1424 [Chryseobacterium sp. StRB126]|uniref:PAAR-like protein n=1 Tax=Chryseobacterium sp. StRB126 TaxID=878220 RepID=UPI0004E99A84|nr:PAAR-like protein [Chryseobacterium sp. StRB126]BAP30461.1 uncharacterized protein CHSO_1424 [Chryseobacterium sp. StRB126]